MASRIPIALCALLALDLDSVAARELTAPGVEDRGRGGALPASASGEALPLLDASRAEAQRDHQAKGLSGPLWRQVELYRDRGDWSSMLDFARRAFEAAPSERARMLYLLHRGRAHMELRERDASQRDYLAARELGHQLQDGAAVAKAASELGLLYWRFDRDRAKALASYDEALAYYRRTNDAHGMRVVLNNSGNLFRAPGSYAEAERRYSEGLRVGGQRDTTVAFLLKNLGIVYRETGRRAQAERLLLKAVAFADRAGVGRIRWQARMELGTLHRHSEPSRATRYYEECLDALEAQHTNVLLEDFSAGALAGAITLYENPYDLFVDHLLRQNEPAKALVIAERARARAFLDTLSTAREAIAARLPAEYVREERALLQAISDGQSQLREADPSPDREARLFAVVKQAEERLAALRLRFATEHPELAHARYPRLRSAKEIAELLTADEAVLEYFLGAAVSTLWVVRREGLVVLRLARKTEIEAAVRRYVALLSAPDTAYEATGRAVSQLLLASALPLLAGVRRVSVIPHGILHYLPFEVLPDARGRLLLESLTLSYAPSASSLAFLRSRPAPSQGGVLAVGDPVLRGRASLERGAVFARIGLLKPLHHAGRELRAVASPYETRARVLSGESATEPALRAADLEHAAIVHFATHGLIDEELPERSGLVLTPAPGSDGLLQLREIPQLRLNAALVTLSGCQTARGKVITGEGMVGLTRAFFHAGAHAVMASLWNVDDASTAELMKRFYGALRSGQAIDEAARSAKLGFLAAGGRLRHPYFWGAFVVSGNARAVVSVAGTGSTVSAVALAAIAACILLLVLWGRRRGALRHRAA